MKIQHNMQALNTARQNKITVKSNSITMERLSSGYRINRAADDASGLAISEKMRKQIAGLSQGVRNIQDGISLCQVADGALEEVHGLLRRINELSVEAANGTNTQNDREKVQEEIDELVGEVDRIAYDTVFNKDIYPLLGKYNGTAAIRPLKLSDYIGENTRVVNSSTVTDYDSYVDADGKTHYRLGSGTFRIEGMTNCVFDVSGETCIEDTHLTNVTIQCDPGTALYVKNVVIDNSGDRSRWKWHRGCSAV